MFGRVLYFILGVIFFLSSTPSGMAKEIIPGKARADFFVAAEASQAAADELFSTDSPATRGAENELLAGDALPAESAGQEAPASPSPSGKQTKRQQRLQNSLQSLQAHSRRALAGKLILKSASCQLSSEQDAQEELTATIRFLHFEADID